MSLTALTGLVSIVTLLRGGAAALKSVEEGSQERASVGLLKTYFLIKDLATEADALFCDAGSNPAATLSALEPEAALAVLSRWNETLDRQTGRLLVLNELLVGQHHLEIIDPVLRDQIKAVIGSKMDSVHNLYKLGAGLFFRNMFGQRDQDDTINYVLAFASAKEEEEVLDLSRLRLEIDDIQKAVEGYRAVVNKLVSAKELIKLTERARKETEI